MKWFYDFKISVKLIIGFVLVAVIAGALGIFGIVNLKSLDESDTQLYENMTVPISEMSIISTDFQRSRVNLRDAINADSQKDIEYFLTRLTDRRSSIDKEAAAFEKTILSKEMGDLFNQFKEAKANFRTQVDKVIELARANEDERAWALLAEDSDAGKASRLEQELIDKIIAEKIKDAGAKSDINTANANQVILIMSILVAVAMILAILLGVFLSRIISKPVSKALNMIKEMGKGHLGVRLNMSSRDEVGQMAKAMDEFADDLQQNVVGVMKKISEGDVSTDVQPKDAQDEISPATKKTIETIRTIISEMDNMAKQHDLGDIDVFVDEDKFEGAYKQMAKGVNDMVKGHISVKKKAMACVSEFAKGNFDAELERFPGKKAFINENIESMRKNLKNVNQEIRKLIQASEEGRLSERGDDKAFQGDWAVIIKGLNGLIEKIVEPIMEAAGVLDEMAKGNLQVSVQGNYRGDHARIKEAMNFTITTISGYINEITNILTQMSEGNLVVGITSEYLGDFVEIKNSLNTIVRSFNDVLGEINTAAEQVASGSRQVSDSSQALSQGSTEQASSIEELTASMTQIAAQTKQNASNANQANELALTAKENAVQGNEQMKGMLKAMDEINQASANISKIIKVIDEIAFQTNILALNAAVEAARAGQHGKGFAVVAEEVRNLAARSANAAKETTTMIEGSIRKVEDGTKIANETAAALNMIVDGVAKAANLVSDIAVASNEQATGIAQVNQGISQVSMVTQTNSATAEESAAASEELSSQAELLKEMVSKFKLKKSDASTGAYNELNPEIVRMLEAMTEKGSTHKSGNTRNKKPESAAAKTPKHKISLSDREFDKY